MLDIFMYFVFASAFVLICRFLYKEGLESRKLYVKLYHDWEKMAADAEHTAMLAESEGCPAISDWLYEEAARRRIHASKYIKYLTKVERAKAIELNTWRDPAHVQLKGKEP